MNKLQTLAAKILGVAPVTESSMRASVRAEAANILTTATAATVQQACRVAEAGDPRDLFRLYRDFVLSDDLVQGCLNARKLAVLGQPLSILPRDKNNPDDMAAALACRRAVDDCANWNIALAWMMDSAFWPVSVSEKIMGPAGEPRGNEPRLSYTIKKIEPVDHFQLCWKWAYVAGTKVDFNTFEPLLKLWGLDENGLIVRDVAKASPLDSARHMVHRGHMLHGFKDNWGGVGRAVLGWCLLRTLGRDWFARFMERYGSPFPKGKTDANNAQAVAFLQEAFSTATKIGGIVIGHDDEVELVQAMVQGGAEGHKLWHDVCNNAISRHLTGNDSSSSPGGLNAGQSHRAENIREDYRMLDSMLLGETLEKQLFNPYLAINGLKGLIKVSFGGLSDDDAQTFANMIKTMKESGLELADESLPIANERTGLIWQRAAVAATPSSPDMTHLATFAAMIPGLRLPKVTHPSDAVASEHAKAVGEAMREAFKPALKIIEDSRTPAECEARLAAFFADWRPKQFVSALEKPLQIAAAKGAVEAKPAK